MELSKKEREQKERENLIIETAVELFCELGFDNVSMDMIAQKSEMTKRTIYRYFSSKEDLFFATAYKGHQYFFEMVSNAAEKGESGFDKLGHVFEAYYSYITKYPKLARLVNQQRHSKTESIGQTSPYFNKFSEIDQFLFEKLGRIFKLGREDGSIRNDLDISELAFSTIYISVGFFQLFTFTGDTFPKHVGLDKDSFVRFSMDRLLETIKAR